ncbi:response regulator [Mucilaginibacter myungsuensis]|uniref:Response regulator n=1 Tax=Mucilaginibacter myungsuensis TaxID=649104 RepID=A0A929L3C3_9SPHI|nr:response regulator [Mucilaginibacter myungsuensis]MBE9662476.1 response regulator [Mucilaginibacter myungsuensis]MDN3597896.1 response regulator [Mucilaginibacter myungsuensis]
MSKKILVIEDNEDILDLMQFVLEGAGFEVIPSEDSLPLNNLDSIKPDLILMDNSLSDGSGSVFCRKLKDDPKTTNIKVVLVSANTDLDKLTSDSGANGFLAKPFDIDELVRVAQRFA